MPPVMSKVAESADHLESIFFNGDVRKRDYIPIRHAKQSKRSLGEYSDVTLDEFLGSFRLDHLQHTVACRITNLEVLFKEVAGKKKDTALNNSDVYSGISLRDSMKGECAKQNAVLLEIRQVKEHLRLQANKPCNGSERVILILKNDLIRLWKQALDRDAGMVKLIEEHDKLDEVEFIAEMEALDAPSNTTEITSTNSDSD
ncbi:hypothetical protein BGZ63DRAFT_422999 [Mariannaea sp. PMI_226]|nr:hypothetical protein BGZ63DRAFT_422999 [Mariannaea sp. PMI_226]